LLESPDADLQILASASFLRFSKIEEETPSYHRSYNDFICHFSRMCTSSCGDDAIRKRLSVSGLEGLLGVIRKTVSEDLAENIWEARHMDKIVGSLLYNLNVSELGMNLEGEAVARATPDPLGNGKIATANDKADQILRELVNSASSISDIKAILGPVLRHMDDHKIWRSDDHSDHPSKAVYIFNAIMFSIQADLAYVVIEQILSHLESMTTVGHKSKVADVLARIIGIGVSDCTVGPAVLEIINALLKHLEKSVSLGRKYEEPGSRDLQSYQSALLRALGEYTAKMPDFQKTENMTFILSKIPMDSQGREAVDTDIQHIFMKALFSVAEKHTSTLFSSTFSTVLLHSLLRLLNATDADVRLLVVQTFQILVDRHGNLEKLSVPTICPVGLGLNGFPSKPNRADQLFVQKSVFKVYAGFKTVLMEQNNSKEFLDAIFTTVALLSVETSGVDESPFFLLDLLGAMQDIAVKEMALSTENRFALHAVAIALLSMVALMVNLPEIDAYVETVINARNMKAPHMLPPLCEEYNPGLDPNTPDEDVIIEVDKIKEALKSAGRDVQGMDSLPRLRTSSNDVKGSPRSSWPHEPRPLLAGVPVSRRPSTVSSVSGSDIFDSRSSSPNLLRKTYSDEVSAKALKNVLIPGQQSDYNERRKLKQDVFIDGKFEDICELLEKPGPDLNEHLSVLFKNFGLSDTEDDHEGLERSNNDMNDENYAVMTDSEPYMKFCPQIFMY